MDVYGGSDISMDDARDAARERALAVEVAVDQGLNDELYAYGDRPAREEIVREVIPEQLVITRCSYGALILNTDRVMFLDIDGVPPPEGSAGLSLLGKLLGAESKAKEDPLAGLRRIAAQDPAFGVRVYRTANGFRGLVTTATGDPTSPHSNALMHEVGCDPLYIRLCRIQQCYRARLTAKPWRFGEAPPPVRFPFVNQTQESWARDWEETYHATADKLAVCRFVEHIGNDTVAPEVRDVLDLHDQLACLEGAPLA